MYPQPNPTEAAAQAIQAARERLAADPPVALHEFKSVSNLVTETCTEIVGGAMCCRPRNHAGHKKADEPIRCDICRQNRGSWLDCRCDRSCNSPCCRYLNQDAFDWQSVPVPVFRKD